MATGIVVQVGAVVVAFVVIAFLYNVMRSRRAPAPDIEPDVRLTALRTSYAAAEVDVIRGLLETNGIPAMVSTDDASGWRPDGLWRPGRVMVRAEDADRAEALIAETIAAE